MEISDENTILNQLNEYNNQYDRIEEKSIRLKRRYVYEISRYSFYIWKRKINKKFMPEKNVKLNISDYCYQIGMVSEDLNRLILNIDGVNTFGNENLRESRKLLIQTIQDLINDNDKFYKKSLHLKELFENNVFKENSDLLDDTNESISEENSLEFNDDISEKDMIDDDDDIDKTPNTENENVGEMPIFNHKKKVSPVLKYQKEDNEMPKYKRQASFLSTSTNNDTETETDFDGITDEMIIKKRKTSLPVENNNPERIVLL